MSEKRPKKPTATTTKPATIAPQPAEPVSAPAEAKQDITAAVYAWATAATPCPTFCSNLDGHYRSAGGGLDIRDELKSARCEGNCLKCAPLSPQKKAMREKLGPECWQWLFNRLALDMAERAGK